MHWSMPKVLTAAAVLACAGQAHAEVWIGAEAPVAFVTSDAQRDLFEPGFLPAAAVFAGPENLGVGLRVRAGFLSDDSATVEGRKDPGKAGLVSTTMTIRGHITDGWIEGAAGAGLTGDTFAPTFEVAAGWSFKQKSFEIGPSARYVRVVSTNAMNAFGSADLVLVGIDVGFGRARQRRHVATQIAAVQRVAPAPKPVAVRIARDPDRLVDTDGSCLSDLVACRVVSDAIEVQSDRIILDERVLFDFDRARVRTAGRKLVQEVVDLWKANPTWTHVTVEGHTDVRGPDEYNASLGELRAERVRRVMIDLGAPESIDVVGVGRARPRDPGRDEDAHHRNRRVEFVIERSVP